MLQNAFTEAYAAFLRKTGMEGDAAFQPDANGSCDLVLGDVRVTFTCREDAPDDVYCHTAVASMEGLEDEPVLLNDILEANFFWEGTAGATLGIDSETKKLVLTDRREASYFQDGEVFASWIGAFMENVLSWREYVANYRAGTAADETEEEVQK